MRDARKPAGPILDERAYRFDGKIPLDPPSWKGDRKPVFRIRPRLRGEGGFALVSCILISLIVITVALIFTYQVRQRTELARKAADRVTAELKAWSALQELFFLFATTPLSARGLPVGGQSIEAAGPADTYSRFEKAGFLNLYGDKIEWESGVTVTLEDLSGKFGLIGGEPAILRRLLEYHGIEATRVNRIIDCLADWQDDDDFKLLNGAESWSYQTGRYGYIPRNFHMQSLDEMLLVMGMSPEIMDRLRPDITYYGPVFNYMNTSATLLKALLYPHLETAERLLAFRKQGLLTPALFQQVTGMMDEDVSFHPGNRIRIGVEAREGQSVSRISVIYNRTQTTMAPFQVELWKR